MLVLTAVALAAYLWAFAWLGIACSVAARSARVAIARAVPAALFAGGGFWLVPGCCGALCMAGGPGSRGLGELFAHAATFLLGFTPPVVLGGLPALEFSHFREIRREGMSYVGAAAFGGVVGTWVWVLIGTAFRDRALTLFAQSGGRVGDKRLTGSGAPAGRPLRGPIPPPPPAGPPGSSGTAGPS
jgi:hypothetical protein